MNLDRLVIARPSGNITALVFDAIPKDRHREIAALVQSDFPSVEQVLFVEKRDGIFHAQMAGGEFCGNAARSLGYVIAQGESSTCTLTMSGINAPVVVHCQSHYAQMQIETRVAQEIGYVDDVAVALVHMEGISFAIMLPEHPAYHVLKDHAARLDGKDRVKSILTGVGLTSSPACGLLFVEAASDPVDMVPYVYVGAVETLYAETACASGSIALAYYLGRKTSVRQPSGECLDIDVHNVDGRLEARVGGSMSILWDGPITALGENALLDNKLRVA